MSTTLKTEEETGKGTNKRGRPRVESQDQNAVERRRTQIRLAQRAYRERKETTISVLEARVSQLRQTIQEMNKTFSDYNDKTMASGALDLHPVVKEDLRLAMERMTDLHQSSGIEDDDSSGVFSAPSSNSRQSSVSQTKMISPPTHAIHTTQYAEAPMVDSRFGVDDAAIGMLGYQIEYGSSPTGVRIHDASMEQPLDWSDPWTMAQSTTNYSYSTEQQSPLSPSSWEMEIPRGLKPLSSYCWHETSFARRLFRHSHERCLDLLTNPTAKVDPTNNRARYSLSFMSKNDLVMKLRKTIMKSNTEPLEDWTMPMLHVGGAGLHFDRDPSETMPPAGFTAERNTGPFKIPSSAIAVPPIYFPDKVASWLGLEGVWFDNRDVEVYLQRMGINVDGGSTSITVELDDNAGTDSSPTDTSSNGTDLASAVVPGLGKIISAQDRQLLNEFDIMINSPAPVHRRKVDISLDKLIYELNERCYCLGRAPGYKQSDVDAICQTLISEACAYDENAILPAGNIAVH